MTVDRFFGRRKGRPLRAGRAALVETLLPRLQIPLPEKEGQRLDLAALGADGQALWLEIGFGGGEHLAAQAKANPGVVILGCEPFMNGVAKLLDLVDHEKLENVRIFPDDARFVLDAMPEACLSRVFVQYPDPWPKKRHAERRFINPANLDRLARVVATGGELRLATDVAALADWMHEQVVLHGRFDISYDGDVAPVDWVRTRYEQKGIEAGRQPRYIICRKK